MVVKRLSSTETRFRLVIYVHQTRMVQCVHQQVGVAYLVGVSTVYAR